MSGWDGEDHNEGQDEEGSRVGFYVGLAFFLANLVGAAIIQGLKM